MTRFLSAALGLNEPQFSLSLYELEKSTGYPASDIKLSEAINRQVKAKLLRLGLDANDTTPKELYQALLSRLSSADGSLIGSLNIKYKPIDNLSDALAQALNDSIHEKRCFAIKPVVLKSLIRQQPPKKAVKALGYRSLESFLKRVPIASQIAAISMVEGDTWQKYIKAAYWKLKPSDFEDRAISITAPSQPGFTKLAHQNVTKNRHNILSFAELGLIVILPLPKDAPSGSATASLSLAAHEINKIRAASILLKLYQVSPAFPLAVDLVAGQTDPLLKISFLNQPIRLEYLLKYLSLIKQHQLEDRLGLLLDLSSLFYEPVESVLARIEPNFKFWYNSSHLGMIDGYQPVSFNLCDTALNFVNKRGFEERLSQHFRNSLLGELMLKYLKPDVLNQALVGQLAVEPALTADN